MNILPKALTSLIEALGYLPGVGPRTAERYAQHLLRGDKARTTQLADRLLSLHDNIKICPVTFAYIDKDDEVSPLYSSPKRDKTTVAVVAEPYDIVALEKTSLFHGTYHVLGGLISPIDGVHPENIHADELVRRVDNDGVKEIILATNASVEGETTALYIQSRLKDSGVRITRLARGLPIGVDLEYADQITLSRAIEGRQQML